MTYIGLVGTGDIGRIHASALGKIVDVELVIAKGRNPKRAEEMAHEFHASLSENYEALLADPRIQGVTICVPNDLHAEYTIRALNAGKSVLCEKPIALTIDDADQMLQTSQRTGTTLMVGHVLRYWEEYRKARDLILAGTLGEIQVFTARRLVSLLRAVRGEEGWRHQSARSGGAVIDLQIHDLDFILWTFGIPERVTSHGIRSHTGAYDHVFTALEYPHGLIAEVESSFMLQGNPIVMDFRAIGSDGSLEFSFIESNFAMHRIEGEFKDHQVEPSPSLVHYHWGQRPQTILTSREDPISEMFDAELHDFVNIVRTGENRGVSSLTESVQALRIALASKTSCETGESVIIQ